jgi:hypothetical protein
MGANETACKRDWMCLFAKAWFCSGGVISWTGDQALLSRNAPSQVRVSPSGNLGEGLPTPGDEFARIQPWLATSSAQLLGPLFAL